MEKASSDVNHPTFFKSVRNYFREYCNCTSIHGFRYFGEKRTYFERGWWFVIFIATLTGCTFAIREVYLKWVRSPVIVSFATRETPLYQIPFPAVTICPEAKSKQHIYNHTKMIQKSLEGTALFPNESKLIDYMSLLCEKELNYSDTNYFTDDFYEELIKMTPSIQLFDCKYHEITSCNKLFKPIITDEGICYTFNMLDRSEIFSDNVYFYENFYKADYLTYNNWSMEKGYSEKADLDTYPCRASLTGAKNALSILLLARKSELDQNCKAGPLGFRVTLHTPMRIPRPSQQYFMVPLDEFIMASIKPNMITTSNSVQMYPPSKRECYFPREKYLKHFKIYTALNCKLECLTNFTLYYCGCVGFYMPREKNTTICGVGKIECMKEAEEILEIGDLESQIEYNRKKKKRQREHYEIPNCDCLPMCNDLTYRVDISQSQWNWDEQLKVRNYGFGKDKYHFSQLVLFFQSSRFITSQRHELYGPTDFLANFGGLLGLFTGFSILSLMEIIYFLTVRLCCNKRLYGYWAGPEPAYK